MTIQIRTEIPGPRSREILARRERSVPRGIFHATPVVIASASGAVAEDVDRNRYLDFAGGIGTLNIGHCAPPVVDAVRAQLDRFTHTCFSVAPYESYVSLAERLCRLTPGSFAKKAMFVNSGAEGIENAVKIARHATGKPAVLCFEHAFHGRTLLTMSLTYKEVPYRAGFGPMVDDVVRVPFAYPYRSPVDPVAVIEEKLRDEAIRSSIAAVLFEPVQGEGGFIVPPPDFLRRVTEMCRAHGILVIADEIQTGFGRTGRMFACEHFDVVPDILVSAKSLAGGLPLAAVIGRAEIMDSPGIGALGGTFGGNPLALAAAHAVLDTFERGDLLSRSEAIGARIEARAREWADRLPLVGDIRRLGGMVALELVRDRTTKEPAKDETNAIVRMACERGVILMPAGTYGNVIRILVPLVVTDQDLDEGLDVIGVCLQQAGLKACATAAR